LTSLWEFDGDATDEEGVSNGTAYNITYDTGKYDQNAAYGNSTNGYVVLNGGSSSFNSNNFITGCWFYIETGQTTGYLHGRYNGAGSNRVWYIHWNSTIGIRFITYNDAQTSDIMTSTFIPSTGQWYHLLIARNGANQYMYINGELDTSLSDGHATLKSSLIVDYYAFRIEQSSTPIDARLQQIFWYNSYRSDHEEMSAAYWNDGTGISYLDMQN
jgi:hypothetical protein